MRALFWLSAALIVYSYAGYPLLLRVLAGLRRRGAPVLRSWPGVSIVVPAHNERDHIRAKLQNTLGLEYPGPIQVIFVSDGSTDGTAGVLREEPDSRVTVVDLPVRRGKAAALNVGLERATHEVVVFSDASIMLDRDALRRVVEPFGDPSIGCVSGEDRVVGGGGEALYGRYELFIRRQESEVCSIVGASGCFYAQRRDLCGEFVPNVAPDFLSVLRTVERGYRAVSAPGATGTMAAVERSTDEFQRKVRTLLRGMTTLGRYPHLINPFRHPLFAFELASHKLLRWAVPFLMIALFAAAATLAPTAPVYMAAFWAQVAFYVVAGAGIAGVRPLAGTLPVKAAVYLTLTNAAVLAAWGKYIAGVRQELWTPSQRAHSRRP